MDLFPPIEPYREFSLPVSDLHTLHGEECGNPQGRPVVFLHGGPGGGLEPVYRQFFNPQSWRVILFDQRGCGRSTPFAELQDNTTWDLVADIERIRSKLQIDQWVAFGGSWGSTLALAYAETHPQRVAGLILRGVFLLRQQELYWFYQSGASHIYPDAWQEFVAPIPEEERGDLLKAFYQRLTGSNEEERLAAARAWSVWEGSTSKLYQDEALIDRFGADQFAQALARIECHYFVHQGWFSPEDQLLRNVDRIRSIPGVIVQGRYDVVCPPVTAWELHQAWPQSEFHLIPDAGHSMSEPGIRSVLVETTEKFSRH